jgi:hypothetical protein
VIRMGWPPFQCSEWGSEHSQHLEGIYRILTWFLSHQPLYVSCREYWLQRPALHHLVPGHGCRVRTLCSRWHLPDASNNPLPWSLLHFPDQIWERGSRILYAGKRDWWAVAAIFNNSLVRSNLGMYFTGTGKITAREDRCEERR